MDRTVWASPVDIPGQPRLWQVRIGTHDMGRYWEKTFLRPMSEGAALSVLIGFQVGTSFRL